MVTRQRAVSRHEFCDLEFCNASRVASQYRETRPYALTLRRLTATASASSTKSGNGLKKAEYVQRTLAFQPYFKLAFGLTLCHNVKYG